MLMTQKSDFVQSSLLRRNFVQSNNDSVRVFWGAMTPLIFRCLTGRYVANRAILGHPEKIWRRLAALVLVSTHIGQSVRSGIANNRRSI